MKHLFSALITLTLFISYSKEKETTPIDYVDQNKLEITDYVVKNNLTAQKSETGLYCVIDEPRSGEQPTANSNVTLAYKGYLPMKQFSTRVKLKEFLLV